MRVLLVTDWNRGQGGAENYIASLRDGLRAAGDEVRLLTSSAGSAGDGTAEYVAFGTESVAAQTFLQIANPFAFATTRRAVAEFRPEVVLVNMFAHHLSPAVLNALDGIPTVLLVSDYKCICPIGTKLLPNDTICQVRPGWVCRQNGCVSTLHWLRDQPRYALIRSSLRRITRVIACSEWVRNELARHEIVSQALLLPVPPPGAEYRRRPAPHPVFVFCGRLDREKGVELLLRAFALLQAEFPAARLRVIGRGPLAQKLQAMGTAAEFCGWLSMAEIEGQLSDAWALVAPSLWAEPLGLVAIEAIIRGVPVIASASGGLAEVVEENVSGLLFPNGDEDALHQQLRAIAAAEVFPNHVLPDEVITRAQKEFEIERHITLIRAILSEAAQGQALGDRAG